MVAILGFLVGTVIGSFISASSERIIKGQSVRGRSYCLQCKKTLKWYDLFPVFSFLFLRGKCRYCKKQIPLESLYVEVILGIATALLFTFSLPAETITSLIFKLFILTVLSIIFLVDLKVGLIPDRVVLPASVLTLIFLLVFSTAKSWFFYQELLNSPLGAYLLPPQSDYLINHILRIWQPAALSLVSAAVASLFFAFLIIITRGKGMGWGDVKYVLFLGLALGFPGTPVAIFLAFILGAVFSLGLIFLRRKHFGQTIPFGPFLSLGAFIYLLLGPQILNWYLNLI